MTISIIKPSHHGRHHSPQPPFQSITRHHQHKRSNGNARQGKAKRSTTTRRKERTAKQSKAKQSKAKQSKARQSKASVQIKERSNERTNARTRGEINQSEAKRSDNEATTEKVQKLLEVSE